MNTELRKKLHAIRERISKAFIDCDNRAKAIQAMDDNLSVVRASSTANPSLTPVLDVLQMLRDNAAVQHQTAMDAYNTLFDDVVPPEVPE